MRFPRPATVAKTVALSGFTLQAATIAGLLVVDSRRKKKRQHIPFPFAEPRELPVGDDEVTVYTRGRDLYDAMLADIEASEHTIMLETYIWKSDRVGTASSRP